MIQYNTELEKILYSIIEELSKNDSPIIFKGALALKELLYLNNSNIDIVRNTVDIDADWIKKYDKDEIIETFNKASMMIICSNYSKFKYIITEF